MSGPKAGQAARAEAWYHLWGVLMELGVDEQYPGVTSQEAAPKFVRDLAAERDRLRAENADLREQLEASEATLEDEEAGAAETFDLWKLREAEASKLRSALGSIHAIATDLCRFNEHVAGLGIGVMIEVELIRDKAAEAIAENQVTDDEGATT